MIKGMMIGLLSFLAGLSALHAPAQAVTWYKVMTGRIDKYPVSMYLFSLNGAVDGYYYYDKSGVPIPVSGELKGGNLQLRAPGDKRGKESFMGALTDTAYSGAWAIGTLSYTFRLLPIPPDSGYLSFGYIWVKGSLKRPKKSDDVPIDDGPSFEASTVWPTDSSGISGLIRKDVFGFLNLPLQGGLEQALVKSKNTFLASSNRQVSENQPSYEYHALVNILYQTSRLVCLSMNNYSFTGGAHGNTVEIYKCYDVKQGRKLNIADVIDTLHYAKALSALLERQYRTNNRLPDDARLSESLFQDSIPLGGNFYLTGAGIGWEYNPYEIGPYALGSISFFLPYTQLMPYLQPSFKEWMGL